MTAAIRAVLVRVGADGGADGGGWNAPVDSQTGRFAYVPIPEREHVEAGMERPYSAFEEPVAQFGIELPRRLRNQNAHLDPDFECLTYGHPRNRAELLLESSRGDLLVFYSALQDVRRKRPLVYALVGLYVVDQIVEAGEVSPAHHNENAHTRRKPIGRSDVIVRAQHEISGRLERCLPFCERRADSYRVLPEILEAWGGISIKDGFVVRAPRCILIGDAEGFLTWLDSHDPTLVARNN